MKREFPIPWRHILSRVLPFVVLALLLVNLLLSPRRAGNGSGELFIYALDVGQSEATLLITGGKTMLIDSGSVTEQEKLMYELARCGVERIDVLLLTHLHEDHIGNARYLLQTLDVGRVLLPPGESDDLAVHLLLESVGDLAEHIDVGYLFSLAFADFEVLAVGDTV